MSDYEFYWNIFHIVLGVCSWTGIVFIIGSIYGEKVEHNKHVYTISSNIIVRHDMGIDSALLASLQDECNRNIAKINGIPKDMFYNTPNVRVSAVENEHLKNKFLGSFHGMSIFNTPPPIFKVEGLLV